MKSKLRTVRLLALVLVLAMVIPLALSSCSSIAVLGIADYLNGQTEKTCEHVDNNNTGYCDKCMEPMPSPDGDKTDDADGDKTDDGEDDITVITIAEALELCGEEGNVTSERYYIRGIIDTVTNAQYGAMVISDSTGSISVYGTYSEDGETGYASFEYKPVKGDEVLLYCILQNYGGTKEVKNARLIEYVNNQGNIDISDYTAASITEARAAAKGANLKVDGVVARITYANGMKPNGFILVDEGASIYVYDADAAQRVAIGNKIEIAGTKDYWILDSEQTNAAAFGYKGCNQLTDAILISNDEKTDNIFDTSWIEESTVKELLKTPVSEDVTTSLFKVTAYVSKVPGNGFVNYYINDLDYIDAENPGTGSYSYTQCNGSDLAWLDEFDGKICTVYLTLLNAKSTSSGCVYRFLPVKVVDEGFTFDTAKAAEHAVKYYGVDQFHATYSADPALELITSVSSSLLGFENAALSYASSDESIIKFTTEGGKTVMNVIGSGEVTVTVTGTYGTDEYSETVKITATQASDIETSTVADAIAAENDTVITVKGIVGPSLANKTGFYLIDDTGIIPITTTADAIALVELGNEVIIKGTRTVTKEGGGQICLESCELVANNYGSHDYSTSAFITDKTLADIVALEDTPENTLKVYVITAQVTREATNYSTNTYVVDGNGNSLMLYAGGKGQYAWLDDYVGQELVITVAVCDWNAKGLKGCVLSITTAEGETVYNTLNFD